MLALGAVVVGCTTSPIPSAPAPVSTSVPGVVVSCGDLPSDPCTAARQVILAAVAGKGSAIQIELGRGVFCPTPGLLFRDTTCPGGAIPPASGGQWIGHAVVTFAGSSAQAYLNLAEDDAGVHAVLIAIARPPPSVRPA